MNNKEKIKKYDLMECISIMETCPQCGKEFEVALTGFKAAGFKHGLIYRCPHCFAELYIRMLKFGVTNDEVQDAKL